MCPHTDALGNFDDYFAYCSDKGDVESLIEHLPFEVLLPKTCLKGRRVSRGPNF